MKQLSTRAAPTPTISSDANDDQEALLVAALRHGTLDGVARAFDRWHQRIRVLARRLLWDDVSAEDVVQDVFASLPQSMRRFRADARLETFVLGIAVKKVRQHQRVAIRRRRAFDRFAREQQVLVLDPEHNAYRRQLGQRMAQALDKLSLIHRVAFVLSEIEGLTSAEAALIVGASETTMRTRLFHARRKLRDSLGGEYRE